MIDLDKIFKNNPEREEKRAQKKEQRRKNRIAEVTLIHEGQENISAAIRKDYDTALRDLQADSVFQPAKDRHGPYRLELYIEENKLIFHITNAKGKDIPYLVLSLKPYQRIIKDYFMIVQSYDEAMRDGKPSRIEAIDMGRRGLHNEGAELLQQRLADKIALDFDTARRLFTLICVLHTGKAMIWR